MTAHEKKLVALGTGAGIVIAAIVVAAVSAKGIPYFANHEVSGVSAQVSAIRATTPDARPDAQQQGTQPGTTVQLTPAEMAAAGVQIAVVHSEVLKTDVDAFGRVEQPESQLAAVSAWIGGRVDKLYVQYTGERVRKGQAVADLYSPEVATSLDEYRLAQENRNQLGKSDDAFARTQAEALVVASQRKLELWGISAKQIDAPAAAGVPHVTIYANAVGTVVERKVTQGQYVNAGETLLTLADLSTIWIKVDVYEEQLPQVRPGQQVDITTEAEPNRTLHGHVEFIEPTASPQTRTVPVHVHLANPGMRLLPGMFVSARFVSRSAQPSPVVPRSAVLDTGTRKIVYVAKADGAFEAREVQLGAPSEDMFPVMSGLSAGDKVVLNGNFLIDSQAQLSSGMSGLYGGSREFAGGQQGQSSIANANGVKLEIHATDALKGGADNAFQATLIDSKGKPITDARVTVTLIMPAMPAMGMAEAKNSFELPWHGDSQMYMGKGNVSAAGNWTVLAEARKDGTVIATFHTRLSAR